jgi:hypothetical protein
MTAVRRSQRHFPEFQAEFAPRGWSVFRTDAGCVVAVHAVFGVGMPVDCARRHGFSEHVQAPAETFRAVLSAAADRFEEHARTCSACSRAHRKAVDQLRHQQ